MAKKLKKRKDGSFFDRFLQVIALKENNDPFINKIIIALVLFGSFVLVSTFVGQATSKPHIVLLTLRDQFIIVAVSYFIMWVMNKLFSFRLFNIIHIGLIFLSIGLMILPIMSTSRGGANAWIELGPMTVQPSEFMKPFIIVLIANTVNKARLKFKRNGRSLNWKEDAKSFFTFFAIPILFYIVIAAILAFVQKDIGTLVIITIIVYVCVLIPDYRQLRFMQSIIKKTFMIGCIALFVLCGVTDIGTEILEKSPMAHIATRIKNTKNPYNEVYGEGYQPANALYGIANANFFGRGVGESARKFGYLTQAENDYIFAVMIEETGIFGLSILVILYGLLMWRLFYFAFRTKKTPYKIILIGNATYIFMHFFLNVGGVTCMIPMTGIPLLFVSDGGSAMMAIFMMFGITQRCISEIRTYEMK